MSAAEQSIPQVPWSYSRIKSFETCPKQFWHYQVAKDFKQGESDDQRYGKQVHKALELRIGKGKALPGNLAHLEKIAARFANSPGVKFTEQQLALNFNMKPTGWFDKDVWVRAIVDLAIINGAEGVIMDWKTGKVDDDFTQQRAAAAVLFQHHPDLKRLQLMYYFTQYKTLLHEELARADVKHVWARLLPRVKKYNYAHARTEFPPRPSGLCKKHCLVTSCPHHGGG